MLVAGCVAIVGKSGEAAPVPFGGQAATSLGVQSAGDSNGLRVAGELPGARDRNIPADLGHRLFASLGEAKRLWDALGRNELLVSHRPVVLTNERYQFQRMRARRPKPTVRILESRPSTWK